MRNLLVMLLLLACCSFIYALDLGAGLDLTVDIDQDSVGTDTATDSQYTLIPFVLIYLSPRLEVQPFLTCVINTERDENNIVGGIRDDYTQMNVGLGAGLNYHFLQSKAVDFVAGLRGSVTLNMEPSGDSATDYDSYFDMDIGITVPLRLDIKLTPHWVVLLEYNGLGLTWRLHSQDLAGTETGYSDFLLNTFNGFNSLYFGFYYKF